MQITDLFRHIAHQEHLNRVGDIQLVLVEGVGFDIYSLHLLLFSILSIS